MPVGIRPSTLPKWTKHDQQDLEELLARRKQFDDATRPPVLKVGRDFLMFIDTMPDHQHGKAMDDNVVDWLIGKADAIRDALAPFDSGVRQADPKEGGAA